MRFLAHVSDDGRQITPQHAEQVYRWRGRDVWMEAHKNPSPVIRGTGSNAYLWAVVYRAVCEETGNDPDSLHYGLKREAVRVGILPPEFTVAGTALLEAEPTTKQEDKVFWRYVNWIREGAETGSMFGVVFHIPEPNE